LLRSRGWNIVALNGQIELLRSRGRNIVGQLVNINVIFSTWLSQGYDSIKSLLMIGALSEQSTDEHSNSEMIEKNLEELKKKLT
ncbi:13267_t:CDS:2, partial [Dentiscutata erythropus]